MRKIHIKNTIIAYLEKALTPAQQNEIEKHLISCNDCKEFLNKFSVAYFSFDNKECPEINPYFFTRVAAKLDKKSAGTYALPVAIIKSLKPVAAGLFLLTAFTFGIFFSNFKLAGNQNANATSELSYEYYLDNNADNLVNLIIDNEK